ncbi:MAG: aldo/keto reductase [Clostridia bacterium]|nr:aldo/keto reductase [Clostridia bacterium]
MYYKDFHGEKISALGFGLLRLPTLDGDANCIDREKTAMLFDLAIKSGINYFDTAFTYQDGDSERAVGDVLSKYPRDSYLLASKFYVAKGLPIEEVFEEQLRRCKTDYFDFYLLHGVQEQFIDAYLDEKNDYIGYLKKQRELGRIRYLGFSSHCAPEALEKFLDAYDGYDMGLIQLNFVDWTMLQAKRQYEILTEHNIPVWVMEPLKGGRLAELDEESRTILQSFAPDRSIASWGMRFLQTLPNV